MSTFKFKYFDIIHNENVMKVGTDAVLLGALINDNNFKNILDIGTGTGLIALMLAQKTNAKIDAIDINKDATDMAKINVENSIWKNRISVINTSLQDFLPNKKYDLIVSNPPFFLSGQNAPNKNRAIARHASQLSYNDLINNTLRLLNETAYLAIIYPTIEMKIFEKIALENNLFVSEKYFIHPKPNYNCIRIINFFTKNNTQNIKTETIIIENEKRHDYTEQYKNLTKEYYVKKS